MIHISERLALPWTCDACGHPIRRHGVLTVSRGLAMLRQLSDDDAEPVPWLALHRRCYPEQLPTDLVVPLVTVTAKSVRALDRFVRSDNEWVAATNWASLYARVIELDLRQALDRVA